jgi:hypothetical protein
MLLVTSMAWATITPGTNPTAGNGCSNSLPNQVSSLDLVVQNPTDNGFVAVWVDYLNNWQITSASWSSGIETVTVNTAGGYGTLDFNIPGGNSVRIRNASLTGLNGDWTIISSTTSTFTFALGTDPGSCANSKACGPQASAVTEVTSITDNATGNTWQELPGSFVTEQDHDPGEGQTSVVWYANGVSLNAGTLAITLNFSSPTYIGACVMEFMGIATNRAVDSVATRQITSSTTDFTTPTIRGNYYPELFLAASAVANSSDGGNIVACDGNTFTQLNPGSLGDMNNGSPAGYFISNAGGDVCAGLVAPNSSDGVTSIMSLKGKGAKVSRTGNP